MGYEIYGLEKNPFPKPPAMLKPESTDPRENGKIFSVNARNQEIKQFEEKFVGTKTSFDDRYRCGLLWAEGDRITGRGMGKTALAIYMKHQINDGYGRNYFSGREKFFCSYVSFPRELKAKVDFVYRGFLRSFINEQIFSHIGSCVSTSDLAKAGVKRRICRGYNK